MSGYITPGEMAALTSRKARMVREEFTSSQHDYAPLAGEDTPFTALNVDGPDSPLGYDGSTDDSTDLSDRGGN